MAQRAGNRGVLPGQRETRRGVVKRTSSPGGNGMTGCALRRGGRETSRDVIRHVPADGGGALESSSVASIAVRRIQRVVVIGMAGSARGRGVRAHQRKSSDAMVERCRIPTRCGVTVGAIR